MSGRRHHDGEPGPTLGEHLKAELAGILRLLLKNAARHSAPLLGSPAWTAFQTGFRADYASVLPETPTVRISPNAVSFASNGFPAGNSTTAAPLLSPDTVRLRRDTGRPTATLCRLSILNPTLVTVNRIWINLLIPSPLVYSRCRGTRLTDVDPRTGAGEGQGGGYAPVLTQTTPHPSPPPQGGRELDSHNPQPYASHIYIRKKELLTGASQGAARILRIPITTTMTKRLPVRLSATRHDVALLSHPARPRNDARMLALPIRKAPVPLHRFPLEMRQRFRQALAEKAGLPPDQIQLLRVFDRLIPDRYAAIRQDEQGILLCTPKSRDLALDKDDRERRRFASQGRRALRTSLPPSVEAGVFYLVIGLRLDTRRELRALVSLAREGAS